MKPSDLAELNRLGADPAVCRLLLARLRKTLADRPMRFMEVCGTHTVSIFQSGLASLLPKSVTHLSGPGCPVCVTHESEIALLLELAQARDTFLATFGDLVRVPGPAGLALRELPDAHFRIVYSPLDCIALAKANPGREVIFAAVGFETTAPAVAATILQASGLGIANFSVLCMHKLVGPALKMLLEDGKAGIDAFLLPGHVATVTGIHSFDFIAAGYGKPAVVGGFEPADILLALLRLAELHAVGRAQVENAYKRAVAENGNSRGRALMERVFRPVSASWRGLGEIPASGLAIRQEYASFDAFAKFGLALPQTEKRHGCVCGSILKGLAQPPDCPNFGNGCQPAHPIGPCMVSTEGSCAAWHKYGGSALRPTASA